MPRRMTMGEAVLRCRRRVDMKRNQARTDPDFKALISEQYGELFCIVANAGLRYFETSSSFAITGAESYLEPTDHLGTVRMARVLSDGSELPIDELMPQEEWAYKGRTGDAICFTLIDDRIFLYPKPSSGTYKLYYIPQPPDLSAYTDADVIDVVTPDGEAFLMWGVAVKLHGELENNAILAVQERDKYGRQLGEWAALRAFNEPRRTPLDDGSRWPPSFRRDGEWP